MGNFQCFLATLVFAFFSLFNVVELWRALQPFMLRTPCPPVSMWFICYANFDAHSWFRFDQYKPITILLYL